MPRQSTIDYQQEGTRRVADADTRRTNGKYSPRSEINTDRTDPQMWHVLTVDDVLNDLSSDAKAGLSAKEAEVRQETFGRNELQEKQQRTATAILLEQLRGPMILLLGIAAVVSLFLGEFVDAGAILAIVILNASLGFVQDFRAERAIAALKKLAVPTVKVRRDGLVTELSATELVPGDIVLLETGNAVPSDCRLVETSNLQIQEAALTGESEPVAKQDGPLEDRGLPVADRSNMAYLGTTISYGHGVAVVTGTGMSTELGRIADSLQTVSEGPTPLQRRLAELGRTLAFVALGIVVIVFLMGLLAGETPKLMVLTALSLAVAIVPEGLPAVATVSLALGARRMVQRQALIRRLPAVETLGSVTVICSDKTGTLTENQMTVTLLDVAGLRQPIPERPAEWGSQPGRGQSPDNVCEALPNHSGLTLLLTAATLCNDSELRSDSDAQELRGFGDPTETAIIVTAARCGFSKTELDASFPRVGEIPFDSDRKCMTTIHAQRFSTADDRVWQRRLVEILPLEEGEHLVCTKGAVDALLERSAYVWDGDTPVPLDEPWRQRINAAQDDLARQGMRVLGVAFRLVDEVPKDGLDQIEQDLIFIGISAMIDPPRREAKVAVQRCRAAGIRPVMITGDHALTAAFIAHSLGISDNGNVVTGRDVALASSSPGVLSDISVYARVSPHDKLRIVQSLQEQGEVVAMTGDGVNDAPALKQADIGVAMGRIGTDVAKEAADMVLLDDNFATIVNAVEEGRVVFDNIRKFVKYTMTSNAGELFVMLLAPLLGMPLPLLPLQILWINLVTDGLPGLALAVEPAEPGTMSRPPYRPNERIFNREMVRDILWIGLLMAGASLALGYWEWTRDATQTSYWRTIIFTVLTISQMGNALATRSDRVPIWRNGLLSNKSLLAAVALTLGLQLAVIYTPAMQTVFRTVPLSLGDLAICLALGSIVFSTVEVRKCFFEEKAKPKPSA